jgi:hypothetical protein
MFSFSLLYVLSFFWRRKFPLLWNSWWKTGSFSLITSIKVKYVAVEMNGWGRGEERRGERRKREREREERERVGGETNESPLSSDNKNFESLVAMKV